ncbi:opacity protein-like surface antigen [Epilithonimonas hungarica]|uniref:porin family protein n=1 Tax=Epilithonimonas hungarica TaxID=454006 RepID=UPI002789A46E|nr:porin family protein [Epilithonimonas hungarica]MDP9954769.1 opacity protein-like surface antigen [Epilithonimonas hungarica]
MKKLFLGLGLVAGTFAFAQTSPSFGLKAGVNVSSISDDGFDDTKAKVGFSGGLFMNAPITEMFSIQPEVMYSQLGAKTDYTFAGTKFENELKLDYVTVPVMFQFRATPAFYIEAGPEFGFLVSAKNKLTVSNNSGTGSDTDELDKDDFNSFNMGAALGIGFDITPNFGINARYIAGFSDVTKPASDPSTDAKNRNNNFQAGLYYKF